MLFFFHNQIAIVYISWNVCSCGRAKNILHFWTPTFSKKKRRMVDALKLPLEERKKRFAIVKNKHKDSCLVIVQQLPGSTLPPLKDKKFIVHKDISQGEFMAKLRTRMTLSPSHAFFLFVDIGKTPNGKMLELCPMTKLMSEICQQYVSEDGALYMWARQEEVFG